MRLVIAIALQVAALISFLVWSFSAIFAPMLFAGGDTAGARFAFALFIAMPVSMVIASVAIWVGFAKKHGPTMAVTAVFIALSYIPFFWA